MKIFKEEKSKIVFSTMPKRREVEAVVEISDSSFNDPHDIPERCSLFIKKSLVTGKVTWTLYQGGPVKRYFSYDKLMKDLTGKSEGIYKDREGNLFTILRSKFKEGVHEYSLIDEKDFYSDWKERVDEATSKVVNYEE